ncbi:MAG: CPBP family intramembrane metalloprotease [Deltaproteobacteria bacterium]|nr:CPBP family intramembrane metalloprotease [Nannocystaceae bacterium]
MGDRWRALSTELALAILGMFVGIAALSLLRAASLWPSSSIAGIGLVSGPVITGIAAVGYRFAARHLDASASMPAPSLPRCGHGRALAITLVCIGAAVGGSIVLGALVELLGVPVEEQGSIMEIVGRWHRGEDDGTIVLLGVSAVLLAPLAEEWLFRGLLFTRLLGSSGRATAYVASAIGFALIHANPSGLVVYVWLGLCFAFALERTGRLWPAIAVHMGNNAFAFAALLLGDPQQ